MRTCCRGPRLFLHRRLRAADLQIRCALLRIPPAESRCPSLATAPTAAKAPSGYGMEVMRCTYPQPAVAADLRAHRRAVTRVRWSKELGWDFRYLINDRPESRRRNWLAFGSGSFDPGSFGLKNLGQGLLRRFAKSGAVGKIGDVGNVSAIFFAEKNVHMVVFHSSQPKDRLYRGMAQTFLFRSARFVSHGLRGRGGSHGQSVS